MNNPQPSLRGLDRDEKAALIVSECQTAIVDPSVSMFTGLAEQVESRQLLQGITHLASVFRTANLPVIFTTVALLPDADAFKVCSPLHAIMARNTLLRRNRSETAIHPEIAMENTDIICQRMHGVSSFHGTELEDLLRNLSVDSIVLAGVSTDVALLGTAIEAINRGFSVVLPEDCTAGATEQTHRHAIENTFPILATVTTSEAIREHVRQNRNVKLR